MPRISTALCELMTRVPNCMIVVVRISTMVAFVSAFLEQLGMDEGTEHYPSCMDDLDGPVPGKCLRVGRQACCVPAVVSRVLTIQV